MAMHIMCFSPDPKCPALVEAPLLKLSAANQTFPVIVFSHGLSSMRTGYTAICCDLASHGYVVAAVEHRYTKLTYGIES